MNGTLCNGESQDDIDSKLSNCEECKVYKKASGDEVKQMVMSFNNMVTIFKSMIKEVLGIAGQLATSSQQLAASSQASGASANEVASIVEDLADGSQNQRGLMNEMDLLIKEFIRKLEKIGDDTENMLDISNKTSIEANNGKTTLNNAICQMEKSIYLPMKLEKQF